MSNVRFQIVVKRGNRTVTTITADIKQHPRVSDIKEIVPTEQLLERLTGLRWHINAIEEGE